MPDKFLKFPDGFYWGAATSAHQVEGNTDNDWTAWEKSDARLAQLKGEGKDSKDFISGSACDHYNRYREDFDVAQRLGHSMHRLSVEWSRIEPQEGEFDKSALQHYADVVKAIKGRGMEPMVTLWHFTTPKWLAVKGGILNKRFPELYKRFIAQVVDNLKGDVRYWTTFNEATTVYAGKAYVQGEWPPQEKMSLLNWLKCRWNIERAHILAYREIKNQYRDWVGSGRTHTITSHNVVTPLVGAVENVSYLILPGWVRALGIEKLFNSLYYHWLWARTLPYQDYIGLNYYTVRRLPYLGSGLPKQEVASEMNWEIYPEGLFLCLKALKKFKRPVFITENGIADGTDGKRERFIRNHLEAVWRAIANGVDVRGYLYWSLLDNFEWAEGFAPRFGLIDIERTTQERTIRSSAWIYARIVRDNGLGVTTDK